MNDRFINFLSLFLWLLAQFWGTISLKQSECKNVCSFQVHIWTLSMGFTAKANLNSHTTYFTNQTVNTIDELMTHSECISHEHLFGLLSHSKAYNWKIYF